MDLARLYLIKTDLVITRVPPNRCNPLPEMLSDIATEQMSSKVESILEAIPVLYNQLALTKFRR